MHVAIYLYEFLSRILDVPCFNSRVLAMPWVFRRKSKGPMETWHGEIHPCSLEIGAPQKGWFRRFVQCSPPGSLGKMIEFDEHICVWMGFFQPPTI